jgi:hypothetical protein
MGVAQPARADPTLEAGAHRSGQRLGIVRRAFREVTSTGGRGCHMRFGARCHLSTGPQPKLPRKLGAACYPCEAEAKGRIR